MIRVLLLGDSIRMGYQKQVVQKLSGTAEVMAPSDNGRDVSVTLWQANQMFKQYGDFDVIHWNNGYWDMNIEAPMTEPLHPIAEYTHFLMRMIPFFQQHTKRLIFATSVPIKQDGEAKDNTGTGAFLHYRNRWVKEYNAVAKAVMTAEQVEVNDLYELCLADGNYYKSPDNLHLTAAGYDVIADRIATLVKSGKKSTNTEK